MAMTTKPQLTAIQLVSFTAMQAYLRFVPHVSTVQIIPFEVRLFDKETRIVRIKTFKVTTQSSAESVVDIGDLRDVLWSSTRLAYQQEYGPRSNRYRLLDEIMLRLANYLRSDDQKKTHRVLGFNHHGLTTLCEDSALASETRAWMQTLADSIVQVASSMAWQHTATGPSPTMETHGLVRCNLKSSSHVEDYVRQCTQPLLTKT